MLNTGSRLRLSDEQQELRQDVRDFVEDTIDPLDFAEWEWKEDPRDRVPWHVIEAAQDIGLHDLTVPEEYGGRDASALTLVVVAEELAAGDVGITINLELLWRNVRLIDGMGPDDLRERFFEDYVGDPRHLIALGLTEERHGSNYHINHEVMRFDTTARRADDGWVVSGEKRFISCGAAAKTHIVFAQTDPTVSAQDGTSAFLIPADADGIFVEHLWEKMGARLLNNATLRYDDVRVPQGNLLGEINGAKKRTGEVLKIGQVNSGAIALGNARRALDAAYAYAHERHQGGKPIVEHQTVSHQFAEMATQLEAARSFLWSAADAIDELGPEYDPAYGQMAKKVASETGVRVTRQALEMFGGLGVMFENDRPIQKNFRDAIIYLHADGTRNAHNEVIAAALKKSWSG